MQSHMMHRSPPQVHTDIPPLTVSDYTSLHGFWPNETPTSAISSGPSPSSTRGHSSAYGQSPTFTMSDEYDAWSDAGVSQGGLSFSAGGSSQPIPIQQSQSSAHEDFPAQDPSGPGFETAFAPSSLSTDMPWMPDGQTFSDQPSSISFTLSPWLASLQMPEERDHDPALNGFDPYNGAGPSTSPTMLH